MTTRSPPSKARRLFETADDVPALIERLGGGLGERLRERLVRRLTDGPVVRESFRREAEALRRELEGEKPTVIERLVVERVVVTWLSLAWIDRLCDGYASGLWEPEARDVSAHAARMRGAASRDHLAALKALALIRKAAPSVTVNINNTVTVKKKGRGAGATGGRLAGLGAGVN